MLAIAFAGCGPPAEPAPTDLDGLSRWFWRSYETASDRDLVDGAGKLRNAVEAEGLSEPLRIRLSPLGAGDIAIVPVEAPSAAERATGMALVDVIPCPLAEVERLVVAREQAEIHPGFERYNRVYTSDADAYLARKVPVLDWRNAYTVSFLGSSYDAMILGGARFVPAAGPVLLSRGWLARPAKFNNAEDSFLQDYQVRVFFERSPGETVHLFAVWREMRFAGIASDDDLFVSFTLEHLLEGDRELAARCRRQI